jgi:L-ascorbate metabolism protein UlaG (beta-lactamase superfamily)
MEASAVRQQEIKRQQDEIIGQYPALWSRLIETWKQPGTDCAWLSYSASYLFRTCGIRWAMDPVRLSHRLPGAPEPDFAHDLGDLSFVLLTHRHADHLDLDLIGSLGDSSTIWVVPRAILPLVQKHGCLPGTRIVVPEMLQPLEFQGVRVTPFDGLHWERLEANETEHIPAYNRGVPAVGYLVEFAGRRWLFPGDTRTYDASRIPCFGPVDGLFVHLWLGRSSALLESPPLLEAFAEFCLALQPRRVVITHLNEFGRDPEDFWGAAHARRACQALRRRAPYLPVTPALMGDCIELGG